MTPDGLPAAGFWRRYAAYAADSLLFGPLVGLALAPYDAWSQAFMDRLIVASPDPVATTAHLQLADMLLAAVLAQAVMALPVAACLASPWRATPGKKLFALVVVDPQHHRLGFKRALGRELGKIPAALLLGIGILAIAWRADRRAWYDVWAGTRVMRRWPLDTQIRHIQEGV